MVTTTKKKRYLEASDIKDKARGNWMYLFSTLTGIGNAADNFNGNGSSSGSANARSACPVHGGVSNKAFYFFNDANETGAGGCNSCGVHSDFGLIMWANGWEYRRTLEAVADALDIDESERKRTYKPKPQEQIKPRELTAAELEKNLNLKNKMSQQWREAYPLNKGKAKPARLYFKQRGLGDIGLLGGEVRLHPGIKYWVEDKDCKFGYKCLGTFPCIISTVRNKDGEPTTLHYTYITKDGKKADVPCCKKLGTAQAGVSISGGCIELSPPSRVKGVGEGLETCLAVEKATKMPISCCVNASMLGNWEPDNSTEIVFIWKDNDKPDLKGIRAGERVSKLLKERLEKRGIKVFIMTPPLNEDGVDWLDVYNQLGVLGFPEIAKKWLDIE